MNNFFLFHHTSPYLSLAFIMGLLSAGCVHDGTNPPPKTAKQEDSILEVLANAKVKNKEEITTGINQLIEGDYRAASSTFNSALMDDPKSSTLHYLNGYTYHLMSERGDGDKYELASLGYCNALEHDSSNWLAYLQLGKVCLKQKKFASAQEAFANALLYQPNNTEALHDLAVASYYNHDLNHALQYITKAVKQQPHDSEIQRSAAIITAAAGENERAQQYYEKYKKQADSKNDVILVGQRMQDWEKVHKSGIIHLAQATPVTPTPTKEEVPAVNTTSPVPTTPVVATKPIKDTKSGALKNENEDMVGPNDMVIIDGAVMRVSEQATTHKGNNILENLTAGFTINNQSINTKSRGSSGGTSSNTHNRNRGYGIFTNLSGTSLTSPLLYSLNIANTFQQSVEVIGRPTLSVSIGKEGDFYSGDDRYIPVKGDRGGSIEKLPIGISLKVTPVSITGDIVTLKVAMKGSSLVSAPAAGIDASTQYITATNSYVTTEVQAKIGETIILAGIKLRDQFNGKGGVPFLQDFPGLQYFFSSETTQNDRRTVLYMLTVRGYQKDMKATKAAFVNENIEQPGLEELDLKNKDWFNPRSNSLMMLKSLSSLYRDFRTGDLRPLQWDMPEALSTDLNQIVPFLVY
ncbi:MAG: hypothetical protein IBJ00_02225 [Alphaproteobacteria bacterium]|nr:hypothetical protein [Alphaproteobacteria bacterium]